MREERRRRLARLRSGSVSGKIMNCKKAPVKFITVIAYFKLSF